MDAPIQLRKKPVQVEAMPFDGSPRAATTIIDWILANGGTATLSCKAGNGEPCPGDLPSGHTIAIQTLEGTMHADAGWWVIRGVEGEFYPCKQSVVESSYERVHDDETAEEALMLTDEMQEYQDAVDRRELAEDADGAPYPDEVQRTRRFFLWRETDVTGVTVRPGEEPQCVAVGTQFADGKIALWWRGGSVAIWSDLEKLKATHLHPRSRTELVWVDN